MKQSCKTVLLLTTALAGAGALCAAPVAALAQSQPQPQRQTSAAQADEDTTTTIDEVVVTGSRIRRGKEFTSDQPIQVVTAETLSQRGVPDVAAGLQGASVAAASYQFNDQWTGYVTPGGGGTQTLSLRGLGEQRTLILLNGRRAGPAGTRGQVQAFDLNVIPQSQVERFEILKDGASSIYGSDAVAGVVNVITRRDVDGGSFNVFASQPFEGGGEQYRFDAGWGRTFDRGYFNAAAEYYDAKILRQMDRDYTACAADFVFDPQTGDRLDYVDPRTGDYKCYNLPNGYMITSIGNFVPESHYGTTYDYNVPGNNSPFPGYARISRAGYPGTYLYAPYESAIFNRASVISPVQRGTINITAGYKITPNMELYTELLANRRKSHQISAAQVFQSFAQVNTVYGAPNVLPASNPNNVLGVDARTVAEYPSENNQEVKYYRAVVGLRGAVDLFGRNFDYDIYGQSSYSDAVYNAGDRIYLDRFVALNSPDVACTNTPLGGNVSNFNCADLPDGIPWMSDRVLAGNFTQQERDFLFFREEGTTTYEHSYIEGILNTDHLFSLPAGPVGAAVGFQVRHEAIDDTPGEQARLRNVALFSSAGRTKGDDDIREVFAEFQVPVFDAVPVIGSLDINLSGRISDYESYGTNDTYKVSANWTLTPEWRLRASVGTSFRAPALYELYLGNQTGYGAQSSVDPCIDYDNSGVSSDVAAACAALGIPGDYLAVSASSATIFTNGGKGLLRAETADTQNFGVIWTPRFARLNVAVDYFDTQINDEVDQFGSYNIIEQCLLGKDEFCGLFDRDPVSHAIRTVNNSYVNIAQQNARGIDLTINYMRNVGGGVFNVATQNSWMLEDHTVLLGGVEEDYLGTTFGTKGPQYAGNIDLTFVKGGWTWYYGVSAIGRGSDLSQPGVYGVEPWTRYADFANGIDSDDCSLVNSYCVGNKFYTEFSTYHSASLTYEVNDWNFQVGINNLFDENPPFQSTGAFLTGSATLTGYDMRGRRGFVRVGRTF